VLSFQKNHIFENPSSFKRFSENMQYRFQDQVAIVTGGAQGIGAAIVEKLAREGAIVLVWDIQSDKAEAQVAHWQAQQLRVHLQAGVDVRQEASVRQAAAQAIEAFGRIDILVNNAGIIRDASLRKMQMQQWQEVIDVNLSGVFLCTQAVVEQMIAQKQGRIINISSVVGIFGNFGQSNYVAAKAGVAAMTKTWGRELGRYGILVNAIAPGAIETAMLAGVPQEAKEQFLARIPLGRLGQPKDIANVCAFLASEEAAFITGQTLVVDGGNYLG